MVLKMYRMGLDYPKGFVGGESKLDLPICYGKTSLFLQNYLTVA